MSTRHVIKYSYQNGKKLPQPVLWCQAEGDAFTWYFTDAQHAALSVSGTAIPCKECIKAIVQALQAEPYIPNVPIEVEWEVWTEGYVVTGDISRAVCHGRFKGETFQAAVKKYADTLSNSARAFVNGDYTSMWGCRFFDNEEDARKSFG